MSRSIRPYLVLIRPANVVTSVADVLAGASIAIAFAGEDPDLLLLILATIGLYGGGIVFNDYFDRELDRIERPERPIPSGKISPSKAAWFGILLFQIALLSTVWVSTISFVLAIAIIILALSYDKWMKHHPVGGPLFMGMARGANLLLGISLSQEVLSETYWLAVIPLIFIASVTLTSRDENRGENKTALIIAMVLDISAAVLLVFASYEIGTGPWPSVLLIILWALLVLGHKWRAFRNNTPENIRNAVKISVLSLILMDASYAVMAGEFVYGIVILSLLPVSLLLARKFAVT